MNITIEMAGFFLLMLGAIFTGFSMVLNRIDKLADAVSELRENRVTHEVCRQRREDCPSGHASIVQKRKTV